MSTAELNPFEVTRFVLISPPKPTRDRLVADLKSKGTRYLFTFDDAETALPMIHICAELGAKAPLAVIARQKLSGKSGSELLHAIKQTPELRGVPFVIWVDSTEREAIETAASLGGSGFIFTDYDADDLERILADSFARIDWNQTAKALAEALAEANEPSLDTTV